MQHMHQHDQQWYDPLHIITWSYWFIYLDFTCSSPLRRSIGAKSCSSFTITRGPSLQSLRLVLHTCNRSIKPSHVLIFSTLITWLMSYLMCNELLHQHMCKLWTFLSHLHRHGICCLHTCTCGLIFCVSHINIISPPKVVTQLLKPNKDLSISLFLVIDDNSTNIWKLALFKLALHTNVNC
jgi:hypothetical protein